MTMTQTDEHQNGPANSPVENQCHQTTTCQLLDMIDEVLGGSGERLSQADVVDELERLLHTLHARLRRDHAIALLFPETTPDKGLCSFESGSRRVRLNQEHAVMLGTLDRILRQCDSVTSKSVEEQLVLALRIRELGATIRRHEAEEDWLIYQDTWRDTGGEG